MVSPVFRFRPELSKINNPKIANSTPWQAEIGFAEGYSSLHALIHWQHRAIYTSAVEFVIIQNGTPETILKIQTENSRYVFSTEHTITPENIEVRLERLSLDIQMSSDRKTVTLRAVLRQKFMN